MEHIRTLLARQGIYDKTGAICAYELLYRNGNSATSDVDNFSALSGDAATSSVITQLFTNLDLDLIIGDKPAFINFTHNHIIQQIPRLLPKHRIVIEVLETVVLDEPLIASLINLHKRGYRIALDDFVFKEEAAPLIEVADYIKIDVLNFNKQQIKEQLAPLQGYKGKFLAEKIEDKTQFHTCIDLGFDYFQGFFLNKPDPQKGQVITESKANLLQLLTELNNESVTIDRIETIILQIPKLSYRILRLANSAALYKGRSIDSLLDAISQLGLVQIRNWLSLLMLASLDDLAPDLIERTLIRAKMCESLAQATGYRNSHQAYTVGILSTLEGMLNEPMASLLSKIHLSDVLNNALLHHQGELGQILKFAIDYEEANFKDLEKSNIDPEALTEAYLEGIEYAGTMINQMN